MLPAHGCDAVRRDPPLDLGENGAVAVDAFFQRSRSPHRARRRRDQGATPSRARSSAIQRMRARVPPAVRAAPLDRREVDACGLARDLLRPVRHGLIIGEPRAVPPVTERAQRLSGRFVFRERFSSRGMATAGGRMLYAARKR